MGLWNKCQTPGLGLLWQGTADGRGALGGSSAPASGGRALQGHANGGKEMRHWGPVMSAWELPPEQG